MSIQNLLGGFDNLNERMTYDSGTAGSVLDMSSTTIDCNLASNFRHLGQTGNRTYNIHNFPDGKSISVLLSGQANNVITFNAYSDAGTTPLTVKYGAGQNGTMASAYTLFTFFRAGGNLNWVIVGPIHGIS